MSNNRIWEIDALRGLFIAGMVAVHLVYDLTELYGLFRWDYPRWFSRVMDWGGGMFFLISGVCTAFSRRSFRRGAAVFAWGMVCTAVTVGMYLAGFPRSVVIWFGTLHCLGVCMMLWPLFRHLSSRWLLVSGGALTVAGLLLRRVSVPFPYLVPLGLVNPGFVTADFFPLLPFLGIFLLGAVLGQMLYPRRCSLFRPLFLPRPVRFLCACGRHSLWIYLLHQPVIALILFPFAP